MSDTPTPGSPAPIPIIYGPPPLSQLWDYRPLEEGSWGNILGFNDGTSDGYTIEMRRWIEVSPRSRLMNKPPICRPARAPLPPGFKNGGTRRCYIPSPTDVDIVRRHFPTIRDPRNPNWFAVAAKLQAKGHRRVDLERLSPPELLALLDTTDEAEKWETTAPAVVPVPAPKRSTERGEGRAKLIAALTKHHQYDDGGCLNLEPIGNNVLASAAGVSASTASKFLKDNFQGDTKYRALCRDTRKLLAALKRLNGEFTPYILLGDSTAKTPALQLVLRPVRERQWLALERYAEAMKQHKADRVCWEREMLAWKKRGQGLPPAEPEKPAAERFLVSDTTVEALAPILLANPRGLLLARDELSGWIGSFDRYAAHGRASTDGANWLSMFNAEAVIVDCKTGTPRTLHVLRTAVCVCGGIQPAILQRALGREHRESGLAARLLLTCPPRKAKRWTEADIDPGAEAELVRLFDKLYELQPATGEDGEPRPVLVRLSGDAKMAWTVYYNAHAAEHTDLTGDLAAAWSKLEEYAARLALVIHCVRWAAGDLADETRLDARSMKAGITLANWFKHEARRVYAMLDESEGEPNQRRSVKWIERKGGSVTAREVQRGCRWLCESGAAEQALEKLVKVGRGVWEQLPDDQRGQPVRRFRLLIVSTAVDSISDSP